MTSLRRSLSPSVYDRSLQNGVFEELSPSDLSSASNEKNTYWPFCIWLRFFERKDISHDRSKSKGSIWKKPFLPVMLCFFLGFSAGLMPFFSTSPSDHRSNLEVEHKFPQDGFPTHLQQELNNLGGMGSHTNSGNTDAIAPVNASDLSNISTPSFTQVSNNNAVSDPTVAKLLIIITPTYNRPFQALYLTRISHTLKLVPPPLLWLVVEMPAQSVETAKVLRKTGVMYRHLVCDKNMSDIKDRGVHQRNVALAHIEKHQLDGIVYFADDDNVYTLELFEQMRKIMRFGTWPVAMLSHDKSKAILEGPVCDGNKVIGWHTNEKSKRLRRFHVDMSGFAFNSTILWDPQRWHRPTAEPIRQLDTIREGFQETTFIEQLVEDESQMEGLPNGCSKIMIWHLHVEAPDLLYPSGWTLEDNLNATIVFK